MASRYAIHRQIKELEKQIQAQIQLAEVYDRDATNAPFRVIPRNGDRFRQAAVEARLKVTKMQQRLDELKKQL